MNEYMGLTPIYAAHYATETLDERSRVHSGPLGWIIEGASISNYEPNLFDRSNHESILRDFEPECYASYLEWGTHVRLDPITEHDEEQEWGGPCHEMDCTTAHPHAELAEIACKLVEDHPLYDDGDYSDREHEEIVRCIREDLPWDLRAYVGGRIEDYDLIDRDAVAEWLLDTLGGDSFYHGSDFHLDDPYGLYVTAEALERLVDMFVEHVKVHPELTAI